MNKTWCLSFLIATAAMAQPVGFGFKGGVPLTDLFEVTGPTSGANRTETKKYILGGMLEVRLPAGLAIEADALYSRANLSSVSGAAGSLVSAVTDTDSWEFPVLLKKKFGGANLVAAAVRPYVEAGASFRRLSGLSNLPSFVTGGGKVDKNNTGFVVGVGVEFRALFLHISPEVRFTRWGTENFASGVASVFSTNKNQGQFLVGFSF